MTPQQIIDAWNAQADEANQWGALGEDEKLMWAYKQAIKEALARQDVQDEIDRGAKTLRETYLAQPEQEPVAWIRFDSFGRCRGLLSNDLDDLTESIKAIWQPLYTDPPQKTWVGLTDEEIWGIPDYEETRKMYQFARDIEAKLKEKNT